MNWIRESFARSNNLRNHYKVHEVDIFIKDALPSNIDPDIVFSYISKRIPSHFLRGVDIIYIGKFDIFNEKDVNAIYQDGAIYVSNDQDDVGDLIDDIIHEIAHSVEELYRDAIYSNQSLKKEFLAKRKSLYWVLNTHDFKPIQKIENVYIYDEDIDMYFYKDVGYDTMWSIVSGLFPSPYSATSLREYFAVGFEYFFMSERETIKNYCPILYSILSELESMEV